MEAQAQQLTDTLFGRHGEGRVLDAYFKDLFAKEHGFVRSGWRAPFPVVDVLEVQLYSQSLFDLEYERVSA